MKILGITHPYCWNSAACLLDDGRLIAMAEEERFVRVKHAIGIPPVRSLEYCLQAGGIRIDQVDRFAVGWDEGHRLLQRPSLKHFVYRHHMKLLDVLKPYRERVRFIRHHRAHALAAFLPSGFDRANVISLDWSGGQESGILGLGEGARLDVIRRIPRDSSWGSLYTAVTGILGFRKHSHEGKVMGLAAYGEPDPDRFAFVKWDDEIPRIDRKEAKAFLRRLPRREPAEPIADEHRDLAATLQAVLEKAALRMARFLSERTGCPDLCTAGGVALNCSMNGALLRSGFVRRIFTNPASHDAGTALGAALAVHIDETGDRPSLRLDHALWGPEFDDERIEEAIRFAKIRAWEKPADLEREVADRIAGGRTVGWFQGRMEIGPRALGARSILANPADPGMKDHVNATIKKREPWRPFAPSMLDGRSGEFLESDCASPFMLIALRARPDRVVRIRAASHVDGTVRAQTVREDLQPRYHRLIALLEERIGVPAVLNTSFNASGQPIVCTPFDAISTFAACGLDHLAIGSFLLSK